ncbi:MAG: hypothetical protein ACRDN0_30630, partial [Trebonia sp.]
MRPPADLSTPSSGRHAADDAWLDYAGTGQGNYDFGTPSRAAHAAGTGRAVGGNGRASGGRAGGSNERADGRAGIAGAGGGAGRARIREAPFGSAPVESIALVQEAPPQARPAAPPRPVAPREPWYQVVGPAPATRS